MLKRVWWFAPLVLWSSMAQAQESALFHRRLSPTTVVIIVGNDTMIAFVQDTVRAFLVARAKVSGAERERDLLQDVAKYSENAERLSDSTIARQRRLIAELDSLVRGYRDVAAGYRRLAGEPKLAFFGGAGATARSRPALIAGVDIFRLSLWGFFQESNAGGGLGVRFKLW